MSFYKYFKPALPSSSQTGIGESATTAANKEVEKVTGPLPPERGSSMRPTQVKIEAK